MFKSLVNATNPFIRNIEHYQYITIYSDIQIKEDLYLDLRRIRKELGISRYQLAKMTGLRDSSLQNIENSEDPNPTFKTMCKIADALEISLDELREERK